MTIKPSGPLPPASPGAGDQRKAATPEQAARQFEAILVRQFVATMTEGLFKTSLSGEEGPGWMASQQDAQRDVLTDVLTEHLVESRALRISDLLVRQWTGSGAGDAAQGPTQSEGENP